VSGTFEEDWDAVQLHADDNVATALKPIAAASEIRVKTPSGVRALRAHDSVPLFHKLALSPLDPGTAVRKYGEVIGETAAAIVAGGHVHVHNLKSRRGRSQTGSDKR
jgi:altronate dehydratase small subunit